MALDALREFAAQRDSSIKAKVDDVLKNDPIECPTSGFLGQGNIKTHSDAESVTEALQRRTAAEYKRLAENIKKSEAIRTKITKGIQAGESTYRLLLQAMECISLMTGDTVFYSQGKDELQRLGGIFGDPEAYKMELEETAGRLEKLQAAYERETNPDDRRRIQIAIQRHQERIAAIKEAASKNQ
jgi:hypothetical protein